MTRHFAGSSTREHFETTGRIMSAGLMLFLLVVPMYFLIDALISHTQYALITRMPASFCIAYFILAGVLLAILPTLIERYRPFNPRAAFILSALVILINVVALFIFIYVAA